jgi:hypothetical protein
VLLFNSVSWNPRPVDFLLDLPSLHPGTATGNLSSSTRNLNLSWLCASSPKLSTRSHPNAAFQCENIQNQVQQHTCPPAKTSQLSSNLRANQRKSILASQA